MLSLQLLALLLDFLVALQDLLRSVLFALDFSVQLIYFLRHFLLRILDVFHFVSLVVTELSAYHATQLAMLQTDEDQRLFVFWALRLLGSQHRRCYLLCFLQQVDCEFELNVFGEILYAFSWNFGLDSASRTGNFTSTLFIASEVL